MPAQLRRDGHARAGRALWRAASHIDSAPGQGTRVRLVMPLHLNNPRTCKPAARGGAMIRVLVCDDHQIVRQGIKQILADAADIAWPARPPTAPRRWPGARGGIDVVLLDIAMPSATGWTC
jgi:PleD family two-component response regulator